jgi:hypothetical protein
MQPTKHNSLLLRNKFPSVFGHEFIRQYLTLPTSSEAKMS